MGSMYKLNFKVEYNYATYHYNNYVYNNTFTLPLNKINYYYYNNYYSFDNKRMKIKIPNSR